MTPRERDMVEIPTFAELCAQVVPRKTAVAPALAHERKSVPDLPALSARAERFLRRVASFVDRPMPLEEHWRAVGIESGSAKNAVLKELRERGLIRLEHKGKAKRVHLFKSAWDFLGLIPPKGTGSGGATHRECVQRIARLFHAKGYDVHIEHPVGPEKKRVDILALGKRRIAIEVGLTDAAQEVSNCRDDLMSGAVDLVILVAANRSFLETVRRRVTRDPILSGQLDRLSFMLMEGLE